VVAWGWDAYHQTDVPAGLSGVTQVAAGFGHSLALKSDGTVVAWGNDGAHQADVPAGLANVVEVAAGGNHSLALDAADPAHSLVSVSASSVSYGSTATVTLQGIGNLRTQGEARSHTVEDHTLRLEPGHGPTVRPE
jgi:hypothetical protein